jgi:hypothetical protein
MPATDQMPTLKIGDMQSCRNCCGDGYHEYDGNGYRYICSACDGTGKVIIGFYYDEQPFCDCSTCPSCGAHTLHRHPKLIEEG